MSIENRSLTIDNRMIMDLLERKALKTWCKSIIL